MDSDKPSNPSSKSGNADDLIEEMAKLMGKPSPSPQPEPETSSTPQQSTSSPEPEASTSVASDSRTFGPREPMSEPAVEPRTTPTPPSGAGGAPGWLPPSTRPVAATPTSPTATPSGASDFSSDSGRQEPSFSLRPPRVDVPEPVAVDASPSVGWKPEPAPERTNSGFQLKRETPRSPETQFETPQSASSVPDFDFGFGSERPRAAAPTPEVPEEPSADQVDASAGDVADEFDPIADLIRDQLQHPSVETEPDAFPNSAPASSEPRPRADSFSVPPVFGLGGDTSKRSLSGSDALDDIENLIGNAVRVDLPPRAETAPRTPETQAPVLHPPVRPHQPRPAPPQNPAVNVDAAEAAILAALASNNGNADAQQGRHSQQSAETYADYGDDVAENVLTDDDEPRAGIRWRRILMPLVALLLLGGVGYAGYTFLTATPPEGEAPVLVADSDPNKVEPVVEATDATGDSLVFNNDTATDGSEEQLVSRDQSEPTGEDAIRQIITADTTENGLANRRVRTVTVRPDGTIVRGDDLVAGGEALPVERPEVPALPADAVTSALADTQVTGLILDEPAADPLSDLVDSTPANLVPVNGSSVPFPAARPDNLGALRAAAPARTTPLIVTQPAVTATPQPQPQTTQQPGAVDLLGSLQGVTPTPEGGSAVAPVVDPPPQVVTAAAWVQLASQRDQAIANSEAGRLSRLYSSALGGRAPIVQRADLADRGVWYRVLVPAGSLSEAQNICSQITNIGGDCFARAN